MSIASLTLANTGAVPIGVTSFRSAEQGQVPGGFLLFQPRSTRNREVSRFLVRSYRAGTTFHRTFCRVSDRVRMFYLRLVLRRGEGAEEGRELTVARREWAEFLPGNKKWPGIEFLATLNLYHAGGLAARPG